MTAPATIITQSKAVRRRSRLPVPLLSVLASRPAMKFDLHTHYYPESFFQLVRDAGGDFSFDRDPGGRTIITYQGSRFFGITPAMTDPRQRIEDMDRVGIDVEVLSISTPNIYFADEKRQPAI